VNSLSDIALIAKVVALHDNNAFDSLVRRYQSPVRRFLLHLAGGDSMLSDDLSQETFIKAYERIGTFKNLSNFQTWLFRIAYNVFYDYIRTRKEMPSPDDVDLTGVRQASSRDSDVATDIDAGLLTLRTEERTCVTLQLIEDLSIDRIVIITGMPVGTVKSNLSRGKAKLANYLRLHGYDR
jgi:RNA polymerase sigma-70 factor, ECF subfamily